MRAKLCWSFLGLSPQQAVDCDDRETGSAVQVEWLLDLSSTS